MVDAANLACREVTGSAVIAVGNSDAPGAVLLCVYPEQCPVAATMEVVGSRWTALVLWQLDRGRQRHGELAHALPGVSPKTLTDRLRKLEAHGLLTREVFAENPPRVEYELTDTGRELLRVLELVHRAATVG